MSASTTIPSRGDGAVVPSQSGRNRPTLARRDGRTGLVLVAPTLLIVLVMVFLPLVWSFVVSFQHLRLINIGRQGLLAPFTLDNFRIVLGSGLLWKNLGVTLVFTAGSVLGSIALGLVAALALRRPFRGRTLVRASMLLPYVAPVVAVTFVWRIMLHPEFGVINGWGEQLLGWDHPIPFLTQAAARVPLLGMELRIPTALLTIIAFQIWRFFPFAFLFIMARMEAMSPEIEEAALVDGATPLQSLRHVILPQLLPVITVLVVLRSIWTFNEFDSVFLLTGGAAGTQVASIRVYQLLTVQQNVGAASAQSIVLAVVLILCLGLYALMLRRRGESL